MEKQIRGFPWRPPEEEGSKHPHSPSLFLPRDYLKETPAQGRIDASLAITPPQSFSAERGHFHVWYWASHLVFMVSWNGARRLLRRIPGLSKINPDRYLPRGSKRLGSPVTAPAPEFSLPLKPLLFTFNLQGSTVCCRVYCNVRAELCLTDGLGTIFSFIERKENNRQWLGWEHCTGVPPARACTPQRDEQLHACRSLIR